MTGAEAVGVGLGFLAIVAPEFWPKMPRALSYTLAAIGLAWLTYSLILGIESLSHTKLQHGPLGTIIAGAILIASGLFWHISRIGSNEPMGPHDHAVTASSVEGPVAGPAPAPPVEPDKPETLEQLFKTDFDRTLRLHTELTMTGPAISEKAILQIYFDMDAGTYFVGFYVPRTPNTFMVLQYLADEYQKNAEQLRKDVEVTSRDPGDIASTKLNDFPFSRRIYAYHEIELSIQEIAALDSLYRGKNLVLQLRGTQYRTTRWLQKAASKKK
jgi:hypothetical protein